MSVLYLILLESASIRADFNAVIRANSAYHNGKQNTLHFLHAIRYYSDVLARLQYVSYL